MVHIHVNNYKHGDAQPVDPLPIGARYYYKSQRVQVVDYHQPNPLFAREYVVASLVTGETRRVFRNELLRVPIDYPPPPIHERTRGGTRVFIERRNDGGFIY